MPNPLKSLSSQKQLEDMIRVGSPEYEIYMLHIKDLQERQPGTHYICLTCWRYLNAPQQRQHERLGHQCAKPGSIRDEA